MLLLLLLLLSHFSRVQLCATPKMAAHQAPLSLGFSRQEHWSGLPFPSPMHESESEVAQLCLTLSDPMDCSLPGSSVHGIFQARVLEWGAIAFSGNALGRCQFVVDRCMATDSNILAWRIPWTRGARWATVHRITESHMTENARTTRNCLKLYQN